MNIFNTPALIYWQINSETADKYLQDKEYFLIVKQIQKCCPLVVLIIDYAGKMNKQLLIEIIKELKAKHIFVKYETNIKNIFIIESISDWCDAVVLSSNDVLEDNYIYKLKELNIEVELKLYITSDNIKRIHSGLYDLVQISSVKDIMFVRKNYDKQIMEEDMDNLLIGIAELEVEQNGNTFIGYKDYEADIKNLSKNRKIQFDLVIRSNGDIALSLIMNIIGGNINTHTLFAIWTRYLKEFWFAEKVKLTFLGFQSLSEQKFVRYANLNQPLHCDSLLRGEK